MRELQIIEDDIRTWRPYGTCSEIPCRPPHDAAVPWHLESDHPDCSGYAVVKDDDGEMVGCHTTKAEAQKHMAALYANENGSKMKSQQIKAQLQAMEYRALPHDVELRETGAAPKMLGHFAVFDEWTEINSGFEGNFMERIAKGSFVRSFAEMTPRCCSATGTT